MTQCAKSSVSEMQCCVTQSGLAACCTCLVHSNHMLGAPSTQAHLSRGCAQHPFDLGHAQDLSASWVTAKSSHCPSKALSASVQHGSRYEYVSLAAKHYITKLSWDEALFQPWQNMLQQTSGDFSLVVASLSSEASFNP